MKRILFFGGLMVWLCSCNNNGTTTNSRDTNATLTTDTNNASKNTGTDMSGGVNSGSFSDSAARGDSAEMRR